MVYQLLISKKNLIFQGFRGGLTFFRRGGPNFSKWGVQMLISIEPI